MSGGGFLGIDAKLVTVTVDNLTFKYAKATLDASKQKLKGQRSFIIPIVPRQILQIRLSIYFQLISKIRSICY